MGGVDCRGDAVRDFCEHCSGPQLSCVECDREEIASIRQRVSELETENAILKAALADEREQSAHFRDARELLIETIEHEIRWARAGDKVTP